MRVRVEYTVEVPDEIRREIAAWYGDPGLASREDVKTWYREYGSSMDDDLGWIAQLRAEGEEEAADRVRNREEVTEDD